LGFRPVLGVTTFKYPKPFFKSFSHFVAAAVARQRLAVARQRLRTAAQQGDGKQEQ
jgi:hypothetical protein